jgi:hypothetical protein
MTFLLAFLLIAVGCIVEIIRPVRNDVAKQNKNDDSAEQPMPPET